LLAGFVNNVHTPALQIPYLTNSERQQLLFDWNPAWDGVVSDHTIHGRFAAQAAKTPRAIAVVYEQESYTYQQLNDHANQVAHSLIEMGVTPNTLVGLCVQRSLNLVVGILGILKAGGAYLPLDPTTPADRMAFMLSDSGVKIVVTDAESPQFADHATLLLTSAPLPRVTPSPLPFVAPTTTAYVIYTSGSTGKPKGVLVTHANVTRLFDATDHWYNFNEKDVWTLFHSFAFDFSVWEIWGALFYGGKLVVVPYLTSRSPEAFLQLLADEQVTVLNQTPSAFRSLVLADAENPHPSPLPEGESWGEGFLSVRTIIFGGEALDLPSLAPWFDRHGDQKPQLVNMYGITETTVHVSYRPLTRADISAGQGSVIGTAIPDLQLYILNEFRQPVPIGVAGEIYVGGNGVASGYLNRPELTAERFIENPFDGVTTLYKTGDVARFLPNRDIEFIGRADSQVKIRGFRIELGEIEAAIRAVAGVQDVIVLALTLDGEKHLVAYLIASNGFDLGMVRTELAEKLPAYMLPSFYQILDSFPLNHNGKLNTKALPQPTQNTHHESRTTNHAPLSTTEQTIIQVWLSILPISHITSDDNFFHIGGNSLSVVKMVGQLRPHFATKVAVHDIFNYPTVRSLANYLSSEADDSPVRQAIDSRAEKRQAAMAARKKQRVKIR
jgi:amino acid adenylation domain-containing protein